MMASAWGSSWGSAWGNAWGVISSAGKLFRERRTIRVRSKKEELSFDTLAEFKQYLSGEVKEFKQAAAKAVRNPRLVSRPKPLQAAQIVIEGEAIPDGTIKALEAYNARIERIWQALIKRQQELDDEETLIWLMI